MISSRIGLTQAISLSKSPCHSSTFWQQPRERVFEDLLTQSVAAAGPPSVDERRAQRSARDRRNAQDNRPMTRHGTRTGSSFSRRARATSVAPARPRRRRWRSALRPAPRSLRRRIGGCAAPPIATRIAASRLDSADSSATMTPTINRRVRATTYRGYERAWFASRRPPHRGRFPFSPSSPAGATDVRGPAGAAEPVRDPFGKDGVEPSPGASPGPAPGHGMLVFPAPFGPTKAVSGPIGTVTSFRDP